MSILKTTQVIKVKVSSNGSLQPLSSSPVVLKNTVREDIQLSQLVDVVANTSANGAYLVYNSATNKYEVKVVTTTLEDISNFDNAPGGTPAANGSVVVFNEDTGNYEVKPLTISLGDLSNVNAVSPADGYLLVYNGNTNQYDVKQVTTSVGDIADVVGTPVDGATLVYNATTNKYDIKILDSIPAVDGSDTTLLIKFVNQSVPSGLATGELAYSNASISLFIGDEGVARLLGGEKYIFVQRATPGILSSNAAFIADSNAFINQIKTEALVVGTNAGNTDSYTTIRTVSSFANSTQLGTTAYGSNSELVTSSAIKTYIDQALVGVGGGSSYSLPIANSTSLGGVKVGSGLTIDSITGVLSATGGSGNGSGYTLPIASPGTLGGIKIGAGLSIDGDGVVSVSTDGGVIGVTAEQARDEAANLFLRGTHSGITFTYDDANDKINAVVTSAGGANNLNALTDVELTSISNNDVLVYNAAVSQWKNYKLQGQSNNIDVNVTSGNVSLSLSNNVSIASNLQIGQHLRVNNTSIFANAVTVNSTLSVSGNASLQQSLAVTGNAAVTGSMFVGGGLSVTNNVVLSNNLSVSNTLFVGKQATFSSNVFVQGTLNVNSSAQIGVNLTVNNTVTAANIVTNNLVVSSLANVSYVTVGGNTTLGSNGSAKLFINAELASNVIPDANNMYSLGTPERRFKDVYVSGGTIYVDQVQLSSPAEGGLLVDDRLTVNGIANISGNTAVGGTLAISGSMLVDGSVTLGNTTSSNVAIVGGVNTNIIPSGNSVYNLGDVTKYFQGLYATVVNARDGNFAGNVHVEGDLVVVGNLTSLAVSTVETDDTIIKLAANNQSDVLDIGFYGTANTLSTKKYYGIIRDATDGKFKLFATGVEPTSTVDITAGSFEYQTLVAYLQSGGFVTNSSSASINANGSFLVTINANTLTLTSALNVTSGGTGRGSFATNAILIGNGSGPLQELAPGSNGTILQIVGGIPTFAHIDCGYY